MPFLLTLVCHMSLHVVCACVCVYILYFENSFYIMGLTNAQRQLLTNNDKKSFDTTFMGKIKNYQNINYLFSFSIKTFLKWFINECPQMPLGHSLTIRFYYYCRVKGPNYMVGLRPCTRSMAVRGGTNGKEWSRRRV